MKRSDRPEPASASDWSAAFALFDELGLPCDERTGKAAHWIRQGRRFGSPRCCIRHFVLACLRIEDWHTRELHPLDERMLTVPDGIDRRTQFVPREHA